MARRREVKTLSNTLGLEWRVAASDDNGGKAKTVLIDQTTAEQAHDERVLLLRGFDVAWRD